tara:strand:- start:8 stop:322 length:315 start_codon:yes stop_codon:yes gene_type:complete
MSNRDPFGHRKYHGLYFILGFLIAFVAFMMLSGCKQGQTTGGIYEPPIMCCMALIPECMACGEGIPVDEWVDNTCGTLAVDVEYGYWDEINNEPVWLCKAEIIN